MKKLPKTVYLTLENEGTEDEYLMVHTEIGTIDADQIVGEYRLGKLTKKVVSHALKESK